MRPFFIRNALVTRSLWPKLSVSTEARRLLTTSDNVSTAKTASGGASSKPPTVSKSSGKQEDTNKKAADIKKPEKPQIFRKKDLRPPFRKPISGFVKYVAEVVDQRRRDGKSPNLTEILPECSQAWRTFSEEQKQAYAIPPGALEDYYKAARKWEDSLSKEAKKALKRSRVQKRGTGFGLFYSETHKENPSNNLGEVMIDRAAAWKALSPEEREAYSKRAAETLFGVRAKRDAQHKRELMRITAAKLKAKVKVQEMAKAKKAKVEAEKARKRLQAEREKEKKKLQADNMKKKLQEKKALELQKKKKLAQTVKDKLLKKKKLEAEKKKLEVEKKKQAEKKKQMVKKKVEVKKKLDAKKKPETKRKMTKAENEMAKLKAQVEALKKKLGPQRERKLARA